jgi:hypothetical protein
MRRPDPLGGWPSGVHRVGAVIGLRFARGSTGASSAGMGMPQAVRFRKATRCP